MTITLTLPPGAEVHPKIGDHIELGDTLFSRNNQEIMTIPVAEKIHIKPETIFHYLLKIIGEDIKKGDIIAQKKSGLMNHKVISDYDGILKEIDHHSGNISILTSTEEKNEIPSFFSGEIESITENNLKIKIKNGTLLDLKNVSNDGGGEVFLFQNEGLYFNSTEEDIKDKVIVIEEIKNHIAAKCEALGCKGFLYLKGKLNSSLPSAQFKSEEDLKTVMATKKNKLIFSLEDKNAIVYD